jgi:hypothetical protein
MSGEPIPSASQPAAPAAALLVPAEIAAPAAIVADPPAPSPLAIVAEAPAPKLPATILSAFDDDPPNPAPNAVAAPAAGEKPAAAPAEAPGDKKPATDLAKAEAPKPGEPDKPPVVATAPAPIDPVLYGELILPGEVGTGRAVMKVTADPAMMSEFKATLGKHGVTVEAAQPLVDLHVKAMAQLAQSEEQRHYDAFGAVVENWGQRWKSDPEIGGAGFQTAKSAIARMRDRFVSSAQRGTPQYEKDRADLMEMMTITGVGNHPALGRLLHNVAAMFDEARYPVHAGQPTKTNGAKPVTRFRDTYDHPRSDPSNR